MRKRNVSFLQILGIGLILCSAALLAFQHFRAGAAERKSQAVVSQLEALLPERTPGIPGKLC